jgi:hypothetical protein
LLAIAVYNSKMVLLKHNITKFWLLPTVYL